MLGLVDYDSSDDEGQEKDGRGGQVGVVSKRVGVILEGGKTRDGTASNKKQRAIAQIQAKCADPSRLTNKLPELCSNGVGAEDEEAIRRYLDAQKSGNFNLSQEVRSKQDFGNPDLLTKVVDYFEIEERGSNFEDECDFLLKCNE